MLRGRPAAAMRSGCTISSLLRASVGVLQRAAGRSRPRIRLVVYILVTLCRFDDNSALRSKLGPFIPCERRQRHMEILRIQGRGFSTAFLKQGAWQASSAFYVDTPEL